MRVPNDLRFDTETYLLFCIYYEANGMFKGTNGNAATYLKQFESHIRKTGQVLEWLGLANPDKNNPLGWKPSHSLMGLIANAHKPSKSKKSFSSAEDEEVFSMIFESALGELKVDSPFPGFVVRVLRCLGLAKEAGDDYVPTLKLRALACERRQADRSQRANESRKEASRLAH
jgi:hypothetical protein